jgi:hypothetical protein
VSRHSGTKNRRFLFAVYGGHLLNLTNVARDLRMAAMNLDARIFRVKARAAHSVRTAERRKNNDALLDQRK